MPGYRRVKGDFVLFYQGGRHVGAQPDGDSIWFRPKNAKRLKGLAGCDAEFNGGGCAQLWIEAVDALELHYKGSHEHLNLAIAARAELLNLLGTQVQFGGGQGLWLVRRIICTVSPAPHALRSPSHTSAFSASRHCWCSSAAGIRSVLNSRIVNYRVALRDSEAHGKGHGSQAKKTGAQA